jgi:hypothetical protein
MDNSTGAKAPLHLWIVGVLALLWNGFGAYDYFMTRTKGAAYIESMMPAIDGEAMMAYIDAMPIYASFGWGLGVWGGLVGSILLLLRNKLAVPSFLLSLIGAVVGIGYQLLRPANIPAMHDGFNGAIPYLIIAIAAALFLYARSLKAKGLLR